MKLLCALAIVVLITGCSEHKYHSALIQSSFAPSNAIIQCYDGDVLDPHDNKCTAPWKYDVISHYPACLYVSPEDDEICLNDI